MMEIYIGRQEAECIYNNFLPVIFSMADSVIAVNEPGEANYWNAVIVKEVLQQVLKKFERRLATMSRVFRTPFRFTDAEGYTFYRFFFNFPIPGDEWWACNMRQKVVDQFRKYINIKH
jgi:hypothetical protein